jgi:soluble lytic murein transglycosylase-like protein
MATLTRAACVCLLATVLSALAVKPAHAELLVFTSGRTMSVKAYRISGDTVTVTLRQGGEATFDRALIAHIAPDEIPEPAAHAAVPAPAAPREDLDGKPYAALIATAANRHGVDPALVHAVIAAESNYQPSARSRVGARGLMQVMPATARDLGVASTRALLDPQANIDAGVRYLKSLLDRFDGDLPTALAAYNAGPGAVAKYAGIPPYPETQAYVRKVLASVQP